MKEPPIIESNLTIREIEVFLSSVSNDDVDSQEIILEVGQKIVGEIGTVVWDGGLVALKYLEKLHLDSSLNIFDGKTVLELGAGTGLCSLAVANFGAKAIATDLPECIPLLEWNRERNKLSSVSMEIHALTWGDPGEISSLKSSKSYPFDYILLVDCLYYEESLNSLLKTLTELSTESTVIYCVYEERDIGQPAFVQKEFLRLAAEQSFEISKIPLSEQNDQFSSDDIHILKMGKINR